MVHKITVNNDSEKVLALPIIRAFQTVLLNHRSQLNPSYQLGLSDQTFELKKSFFVKTLYPFEPVAHRDLSLGFIAGEIIQVFTLLPSGWWDGVIWSRRIPERGWFPSNYVRLIKSNEEIKSNEAINSNEEIRSNEEINLNEEIKSKGPSKKCDSPQLQDLIPTQSSEEDDDYINQDPPPAYSAK